jgi:hypothetical protein
MTIYLFEGVSHVSDYNYHSGGAVMVIASTEGHVKALLEPTQVQLYDEDWAGVRTFPTHSYVPAEVFIFPDAGCC